MSEQTEIDFDGPEKPDGFRECEGCYLATMNAHLRNMNRVLQAVVAFNCERRIGDGDFDAPPCEKGECRIKNIMTLAEKKGEQVAEQSKRYLAEKMNGKCEYEKGNDVT